MNIPENNINFIHKISSSLIRVSPEFKSILQSNFPDIYADIESASTNPNCSCVGKVENKILQNKDQTIGLLGSFLSNKDGNLEIQGIINLDYSSLTPKPYAGKMFVIENTEEKFKQLLDFINKDRGQYRNFSTAISPEGKLHIYFI
jgi:hypothetical protein